MVDYESRDLFLKSSIEKQWIIETEDKGITITNNELECQSIELTESICSESVLRFGCCESSVLKFKVHNVVLPLKGKKIEIKITFGKNQDNLFVLGEYIVYSDKPTADKRYREIIAYDSMYDIITANVADWYNGIIFPTTLKDFRDSFFKHIGIKQEEAELPNDEMIVEKTIEPSELSGKTVATSICEINGCFGHIGRNGNFKYIFLKELVEGLYPSNTLYPSNDLFPADSKNSFKISKNHYSSATYENYKTAKISKLQIRTEENDVGCIYGEGNNCYVVQDNFLVYGKTSKEMQGIARNMFGVIEKVRYRPATVEAMGNPSIEVGEGIRLQTKYEIIYTYILQRTLRGTNTLKDRYESSGEEYQSTNVNSVRDDIIQLKGKTNKLTRTIEETRLEMNDIESGLSTNISIIAGELALKVSKSNIVSEINLTSDSAKIQAAKIDLVGLVNANELVSKFATITTLNATTAELKTLIAQKATISQLNALEAYVGRIDADYASVASLESVEAKVNTIQADYVTVSQLNAVDGKFNNLNANNIKAGTMDIDRIDLDGLSSKVIEVNTLVAAIRVTAKELLNAPVVRCNELNDKEVSWTDITVGGKTYTVLTAA